VGIPCARPEQRPLRLTENRHIVRESTLAKTRAQDLAFDLGGRGLKLEDLWINILPEGGTHASHIHPHSVISGTTYVAMPDGASALKLEDPRHAMMMAAPPRLKEAREDMRSFVYKAPRVGDVLLWESWLRHEVPMNQSEDDRISVSFNYAWD